VRYEAQDRQDALIERIVAGWLPPFFAAIDFETANLRADSACAVSVARVQHGAVRQASRQLINPPPGPFVFTWVHGIRRRDVAKADSFRAAWPLLSAELAGAAFVAAHNAGFDRQVLEAACSHAGINPPTLPFLCTVRLARRVWGLERADLPSVCRLLGIPLTHHDPRSDASACARIVVAASRTAGRGSRTCEDDAPATLPATHWSAP
jgi:DNA polymerase-3 subunit epsilon